MKNLALIVGYLGDTKKLTRYDLFGKSIAQYFYEGSDGDINLIPDFSRIDFTKQYDGVCTSLILHTALNKLLQRVPNGSGIGLIFARTYKSYPKALGVMFDRGFRTPDDPYGGYTDFSVPRLGCAVFLDKIMTLLGNNDYIDESIYTAIHELGHVFNLLHNNTEPNFMKGGTPSPLEGEAQFRHADQGWLGLCSRDSDVAPGGSPFIDMTGALSSTSANNGVDHPYISLEISTVRSSIFRSEPLELDIRIKSLNVRESITIPDEIDPGYPCFKIWIEHPSGERRLYRTARHYCPSGNTRQLAVGEVFERDISIFGQSGGYTFSVPGEYSIWAELNLGQTNNIRSNILKIEVILRGKLWKVESVLDTPGVARILFYRQTHLRSNDFRKLREYRAGLFPISWGSHYM